MILPGQIRGVRPQIMWQDAGAAGGQPASLMDGVRRIIRGRNNLDMTPEQFLLHRETELQQHVAERIREYEAMLTVIGYLAGTVTPPPPMTTESVRAQVTEAIRKAGGSLLERSQRTFWDNFNPLNAASSAVALLYYGSSGVASAVGADGIAKDYYDIAETARNTDVVALVNNAVSDLMNSIIQGLTDYWNKFWAEADANGFLIAYGKLRIDAGFLAAELAIDIALGAVTGGAGAAASRVIRVVGTRVSRTVTRVVIKIGDGREAIPNSQRILQLDVPDTDIPPNIERLLDEDNLGGAGPLADTRQRAGPIPVTPATSYIRGSNSAAIVTDPVTGRPVSGRATIREDFGGGDRLDNATAIGQLGREGDHGGHIFAHRFFGDVPDSGIVPQAGNLNTGAWKTMENEWADWLAYGRANGKRIEIDVNVQMDPPGAVRPDRFRGVYNVFEILPDGTRRQIRTSPIDFRNEPGETFDRVYFRTDPDGSIHIR